MALAFKTKVKAFLEGVASLFYWSPVKKIEHDVLVLVDEHMWKGMALIEILAFTPEQQKHTERRIDRKSREKIDKIKDYYLNDSQGKLDLKMIKEMKEEYN